MNQAVNHSRGKGRCGADINTHYQVPSGNQAHKEREGDAGAGHRELALQAGRRAVEILPPERDRWAGPAMIVGLGDIYLLLGDVEGAVEQYQRVVTLPSLGAYYRAWLRHHPFYEPFRADPRFQRLLEEQ